MRSSTASHLPGRCHRCWIRLEFCICPLIPSVRPRAEVVVVRHEREAVKSTGTARVAGLAIEALRFVDFGDDPTLAAAALASLTATPGTFLVFPAEPRAPWPTGPVGRLLFLDGTWRQTRKMLKKLPPLDGVPRLWLPPKVERVLRLRASQLEDGRSTLEAIADALALVEGEAVAAPLHALHAAYVEKVLRARGVLEQKQKAHERERLW